MSTAFDLRSKLRELGYYPLPACGKAVFLTNWSAATDTTIDDYDLWRREHPDWDNTSILTVNTPAFDSDILDPEAAAAIKEAVIDWADEHEATALPIRTGLAPKCAFFFRTDMPFPKLSRTFRDKNGKTHKLEFLCDGQQIVVDGIHPDTQKPYVWHANRGLDTVPHTKLLTITAEDARDLFDRCTAILLERFDFSQTADATNRKNGDGADKVKVDVEAEFASMTPDNVNDVHIRVIPARIWQGFHPNDILAETVNRTMQMAAACGLKEWTTKEEAEKHVAPRITSALKNLFMSKYDPATGLLPSWLCPDFHKPWIEALAAGKEPRFGRNNYGFFIRPYDREDTAEKPRAEENKKEDAGNGERVQKKHNTVVLRPYVPLDPTTFPPRQWLYGKHYLRRVVSCTAGPGGFGKSTVDMEEGIAMATCRNLLGEQPTERLRVWYHNGEDNYEELNRRVLAICQHFGIPQEELVGWFFMTSGNEFPLRVASGYNSLVINDVLISQIKRQIGENQIDVAQFDPLITLHGVPENDNVKMAQVVHIFGNIADEFNNSIELCHHMRKPGAGNGQSYDANDTRGAGSIHDTVRALRVFNRMSPEEAVAVNIPDYERPGYFRVDKGKGNYSPATKAVWRRFVNVELPNGDEVGVVDNWNYPGQGLSSDEVAELERTADYVFMQLLTRFILQGTQVNDSPKGNYAPRLFAEEPEAKVAKLTKTMLEGAMKRLFRAGKIRIETGGSGHHSTKRMVPIP